jgi:hypothetical protein
MYGADADRLVPSESEGFTPSEGEGREWVGAGVSQLAKRSFPAFSRPSRFYRLSQDA